MKQQLASFVGLIACSLATVSAHAQTITAPSGSVSTTKSRYEATHEGSTSVFRRDPNVWVLTPEAAQRAGMPMEWASTELKGVAAAAFRREPVGAEMDCGWGSNKNACSPVVDCVLELYFDRSAHPLPWREGSPVADFDPTYASSGDHFLINVGYSPDPVTKATTRKNTLNVRPVFTDPETGQALKLRTVGWAFGYLRVLAYDREAHGSYSYVKLSQGCSTGRHDGAAKTIELISETNTGEPIKTYYTVTLPANWVKRTYEVTEKARADDERFYQGVFKEIQGKNGGKP